MSSKPHRLGDYLSHILDAIEQINIYTDGLSENDFFLDRKTQDAVIRNLEIIGEASRNIQHHCPEFFNAHPEMDLQLAKKMRDRLIHVYFDINLGTVWSTVRDDLRLLHKQVQEQAFALKTLSK